MYSNITSCLRFLPMDLSGSFDGENSWENWSKKKKRCCMGKRELLGLLNALKRIQKTTQENAFEFIQRISHPPFKQLGNRYLGLSRLNVTNATRDVQKVPVSRVPRHNRLVTATLRYACLPRVRPFSLSATTRTLGHYWTSKRLLRRLLWSDLKRQLRARG